MGNDVRSIVKGVGQVRLLGAAFSFFFFNAFWERLYIPVDYIIFLERLTKPPDRSLPKLGVFLEREAANRLIGWISLGFNSMFAKLYQVAPGYCLQGTSLVSHCFCVFECWRCILSYIFDRFFAGLSFFSW